MTLAPLPSPLAGLVAASPGLPLDLRPIEGALSVLTGGRLGAEFAFSDVFEEGGDSFVPVEHPPVESDGADDAGAFDEGKKMPAELVQDKDVPDAALFAEPRIVSRNMPLSIGRFEPSPDPIAEDKPVLRYAVRRPGAISDAVGPVFSGPVGQGFRLESRPGTVSAPSEGSVAVSSQGGAPSAVPAMLYTPPKAQVSYLPPLRFEPAVEPTSDIQGNRQPQGKTPPPIHQAAVQALSSAVPPVVSEGMRMGQSLIWPKTAQNGSAPSIPAVMEPPAKVAPLPVAPAFESEVAPEPVPRPEARQQGVSVAPFPSPSTLPPEPRQMAGAVVSAPFLSQEQTLFRPEWLVSTDSGDVEINLPGSPPVTQTVMAQPSDSVVPRPGHIRHVAYQLAEAVARGTDRPVDLTLNPQELGRVRLSMTMADGAIAMTIIAERPETLDLMRRHIDQLAQDFRDLGYGNIQFSFGHYRQGSGDDSPPHPPHPQVDAPEMPGPPPVPGSVRGETALDIRV